MVTTIEVKQTKISELPVMDTIQENSVIHVEKDGVAYQMQAELLKALPTVTADDEGKVLTVVNGAWAVGAVVAASLPEAEEVAF